MNNNRTDIARLWQRILRSDPKSLFLNQYTQLLDRNWGDRIAQPGYVGEQYEQSRLMFVAQNPGGGEQEGLSREARYQFEALQDLRDANDIDLVITFNRLTKVLANSMSEWKIFKNSVKPILDCAGLDFSQVAYLNLLKWRTQSDLKSSNLNKLYDMSWEAHTREQLELLAPQTMIAVGKGVYKALIGRYQNNANIQFDVIPQVIGNSIGSDGREAIDRICSWLNQPKQDISDLGQKVTIRRRLEQDRIIRDSKLAQKIKLLYKYRCQICGETIILRDGVLYSEVHHIKPLGEPHNGPDILENMLCVCPNCHVKLDYGAIELDISNLLSVKKHIIGEEFVIYHNQVICSR